MCKICVSCKGVMNFDPYFEAEVCGRCGKMERKKSSTVIQVHGLKIARNVSAVKLTKQVHSIAISR